MNKIFGFLFLGISLTLLFFGSPSITGDVVAERFYEGFVPLNLIAMGFLLAGILVFTTRKSLDAIIVPTSGEKEEDIERADRGAKEKAKTYLISGHIDKGQKIDNQSTATIYRELRKQGIIPRRMKVEGKSHDSLENALYSFEKLKNIKKVGIVSYPWHLKRYKEIINEMKKEDLIPKDIKVSYIPTKETFNEKLYGVLGLVKEKYRLRHGVKEAQKHRTGWFGNMIKNVVNKL